MTYEGIGFKLDILYILIIDHLHIVCSHPFQKGGTQNLNISKRGGPEEKNWGRGNQKGWRKILKNKGGNPTL